MSSTYSSRRSSITDKTDTRHASRTLSVSKTAPHSPPQQRVNPVFHSASHSRSKISASLADDDLDIELLAHKLQLYQLEIEQATLRAIQKSSAVMQQVDQDHEAASIAAAAKFRQEIEQLQQAALSENLINKNAMLPERTSSKIKRPRSTVKRHRPVPLELSGAATMPQAVQSARLPPRTTSRHQSHVSLSGKEAIEGKKQDWRRMTIAGGKHASVVMMSSSGHIDEFDLNIPPMPSLSRTSSSVASPLPFTPKTPTPTEDQIRRELETFALEESSNLQLRRRSSFALRRRAAYIPDPDDIMDDDDSTTDHKLKTLPSLPSPDPATEAEIQPRPSLSRRKSIFGRFERKNEVDTLLDLYLTDEQIEESRLQKRKSTKSRRFTLFRKKLAEEAVPQMPAVALKTD